MNQQTFRLLDNAKLRNLNERLRALKYTEEQVAKRLRIWHISAITLPEYPIYQERLIHVLDGLSIIISLLLLQGAVPREAADWALGSDVVNGLLLVGLLTRAGTGGIAASVSIYPCSGFYFITDHHFRPVSHHYQMVPDQPVMHLGQDSYTLAYLASKSPRGGRVLDLCAGSGVHAIQAARRAKSVIGVDINLRAVEFARLSAMLNGVAAKCDFRCGNLYDALEQGPVGRDDERFDLILANPPFVPSARTGSDRVLFQDAGPAGDEILGPLLAGLLDHLTPTGSAAIISLFADQKGANHKARIKRWIGSRTPVDLLLLKIYTVAPEELALWFTWNAFGDDFAAYSQRYKQWLDGLKSQKVAQLTYGVLVVRLNRTSSFRTVDMPVSQVLCKKESGDISRLMTALGESTTA